jgi:hypothetical protein
MHVRPRSIMVPLLATILVSPVVQAIGESSSDAESFRANLAVLPAPIGHRQPTLDDLPPWLRDTEKPGTLPNPTQGSEQRRTPKPWPDAVPRVCEPC